MTSENQEYILSVTKRELDILRGHNTQKMIEARIHVQNISLIYQDMMRNESYLSYIEEMQNLENKMLVLTKKINGME